MIYALRTAGYDGAISIEHEDALASRNEGIVKAIGVLKTALLREPPVSAYWAN
jgi:sugar phosphate isomerase/epimerase